MAGRRQKFGLGLIGSFCFDFCLAKRFFQFFLFGDLRISAEPQRFQERTHFRLAWRTPQVRTCLCLIAAAAALISTNEWRRGACHSRIKPLLAACVCAVGMWATRLRCPSEAAYPQPAGDSAVGSAAPGGGSGGRLN